MLNQTKPTPNRHVVRFVMVWLAVNGLIGSVHMLEPKGMITWSGVSPLVYMTILVLTGVMLGAGWLEWAANQRLSGILVALAVVTTQVDLYLLRPIFFGWKSLPLIGAEVFYAGMLGCAFVAFVQARKIKRQLALARVIRLAEVRRSRRMPSATSRTTLAGSPRV